MSTTKIQAIIAKGGKVQPGVWLATAEEMAQDQQQWADTDSAKNVDLSTHPYWAITDDGQLIGMHDDDGLEWID